ncbi:uncharacterized protein LOC107420993 isoform X1 [Ziziphus jujuba]|uniref:Uncharacterized protein LOC107420993 isoform X1 n=1 Tax=Ziziphus jujuba TaxID=326968 RepID=A0A6P3ZVH4_ZIZJJ|nr:uncharacterized protein LOC107420993 isoform X1 [Ziziphus jujuba]
MRRRLWAWFWLVTVMTGGRCHRRKKMMGRGADGGCGTEERPCPVHKVPAKIPTTNQKEVVEKPASVDIDFYSQAKKALCERSPFDVAEEASASTVPTLPNGLASFLSRQSDSRKRHKKSHSSADKKKSSSRASEKSRVSNIWVDTEVYFRDLTLPDIDALSEVSSFSNSTTRKCFLIPCLGNVPRANAGGGSGENVNGAYANGVVVKDENVNGGNTNEGLVIKNENVDGGDGIENVNGNENGVVKEEVKPEGVQSMEIDGVEDDSLPQKEKDSYVSDLPTGLEWLLGCRNKISLTSERPSKKRKLLGVDAGLEKVLVACSCSGNSSLCHFCSAGDTGKELNRLIVCSSCQVAVHQKCYGVQEPLDSSWLCTWCKQKTDKTDTRESVKPCVLCPKQGGALKPVFKNVESDDPVEFAHLFCCQWMPEVYIMDLMKMEPIMNVEGIKETRRKLVCNICKVKCGACVRCSHGTCRTSFHPLCAREARHRMEVWGKYGCDNVELRAFCSKHSDILDNDNTSQLDDPSVAVGSDYHATNKLLKLKIDQKNGDNIAVHTGTPDTSSDPSDDSEPREIGLADSRLMSVCNDAQPLNDVESFERGTVDVDASDSINFKLILKKLVDRGRVNVKDVASDIGVAPDSLSASLAEDTMVPDVLSKIVKWLKNHAYLNTLQKNLRVKIRPSISSKAEFGANGDSDNASVSESDVAEPVAVKSVPPRRRTKSNVRFLMDTETLCSTDEISGDSGKVMNEAKVDQVLNEEADNSSKSSLPDVVEKNMTQPDGFQHSSQTISPKSQVSPAEPLDCRIRQSGQGEDQEEEDAVSVLNTCVNADGKPPCSIINSVVPDLKKTEAEEVSSFYIHPDVQKKLLQIQNGVTLKDPVYDFNGAGDDVVSRFEASANAGVCCDHQSKHARCNEVNQLVKAEKMGILEVSPEDEVEGELIYFQHRLLENAVARKHFIENLTCNVAKSLPEEIDLARTSRWDAVLVNQYLCELREAKKQGRKERRHKEAQAVLAAATAAAAASSRISSFRKDAFDETSHQENMMKLNTSSGRSGSCSQLIPRAKETLQRVAVPRISLEKHSDFAQSVANFSKEHPRSCDICRRSETILNPILVCSGCKVAVHLDCYRSVKESTGPWYCEVCEEASASRNSGAPAVNFWEQSFFVAECGLCGGTTGAFRKSSGGQWVHAFCAEWVFETTFRRGQVNPVEGMETVPKGVELCYVCRRKSGVCIKCSYGHCQATFHPSCARSAGYYMNVKTAGGKQQHKAYCEKHSVEQRAKAETQKHGIEELKSLKQIRVELEKLRLLCERIIKREKLKRELVVCSHDILAVKRDHVARSLLVRSPFVLPDVSSESATTSLKGHTDGYKSCSEAIQQSDDVTVDSTVSVKHETNVPVTADDQRTDDDCSTSQSHFTRKPTERQQFAGKQIPHRSPPPIATRNLSDDGGWRSKSRKHAETFEKELVMTSDQASVKNMRLPKGYAYVPADCLPNEKQTNQDCGPDEPIEHGG